MSCAEIVTVTPAHAGERLDQFLAGLDTGYSRSYLQRLIREERVLLNGCPVRKRQAVAAGDVVSLDWPPQLKLTLDPQSIDFDILSEDEEFLVINKPAGLTVHPGSGRQQQGTLVNALLGYNYDRFAKLIDAEQRPGIVHRLDRDTSGVMVVATTAKAKDRISRAFARRRVEKVYLALSAGSPEPGVQKIQTLIGRNPKDRKKMAVVSRNGREAVTQIQTIAVGTGGSLLKINLETGRTHQIRVHLAHIGCPVIGDPLYGGRRRGGIAAARQMLHAWQLQFPHPVTDVPHKFFAEPPADFFACMTKAGIEVSAIEDCK